MTVHLHTRLAPTVGDNLPRAYLGGVDANIPILEWAERPFSFVTLELGNNPDPAGYLRDLAALCLGLAEQVDGLPLEVTA